MLYFAFEEIVGRLNCVNWRDGCETRHLFRPMIAQSDGTNLALLVEFTERGGCLLDGDERIRPVHLIYINVLRLETAERVLEFLENSLACGVSLNSAGGPVDAHFRGQN